MPNYSLVLQNEGSITLPVVRSHNTSAWAQYTIRVADRDEIRQRLAEQGIPSAVHYPVPLYDQPALAQSGQNCPESDRAAREVLSLPMHPYLDDAAQIKVAQALLMRRLLSYCRQACLSEMWPEGLICEDRHCRTRLCRYPACSLVLAASTT